MAVPKTWLLRELGVIGLLLALLMGTMAGLAYGAWSLFNRMAPAGFSFQLADSSSDADSDASAAEGDEAAAQDAARTANQPGQAAADAVIDDIAADEVKTDFSGALVPGTAPPPPRNSAEARKTRALILAEVRTQLRAQNPEGAAQVLTNYLTVDEAFPLGHRELGRILAQHGVNDAAIQHFERYLALMPQASDRQAIQKRIALLARKLGADTEQQPE